MVQFLSIFFFLGFLLFLLGFSKEIHRGFSVVKRKGQRPFGRNTRRWESNIIMNFEEILGCIYRGADKFLAQPGRKRATATKL